MLLAVWVSPQEMAPLASPGWLPAGCWVLWLPLQPGRSPTGHSILLPSPSQPRALVPRRMLSHNSQAGSCPFPGASRAPVPPFTPAPLANWGSDVPIHPTPLHFSLCTAVSSCHHPTGAQRGVIPRMLSTHRCPGAVAVPGGGLRVSPGASQAPEVPMCIVGG